MLRVLGGGFGTLSAALECDPGPLPDGGPAPACDTGRFTRDAPTIGEFEAACRSGLGGDLCHQVRAELGRAGAVEVRVVPRE